MSKLKACPFCGYSAKAVLDGHPNKGYVKCVKCTAKIKLSTLKRSIEAWNRRASDD